MGTRDLQRRYFVLERSDKAKGNQKFKSGFLELTLGKALKISSAAPVAPICHGTPLGCFFYESM